VCSMAAVRLNAPFGSVPPREVQGAAEQGDEPDKARRKAPSPDWLH
jgi:hypothetical protein